MKLEGVHAERMWKLYYDLRDGEHVKGRGKLHIVQPDGSGKWCCLGRAGAVASDGGCPISREIITGVDEDLEYEIQVERFGNSTETLDPKLQNWYGFSNANPMLIIIVDGKRIEVSAASLNDSGYDRAYSLPEIAEAFRRTYLEDSPSSEGTTSAS